MSNDNKNSSDMKKLEELIKQGLTKHAALNALYDSKLNPASKDKKESK